MRGKVPSFGAVFGGDRAVWAEREKARIDAQRVARAVNSVAENKSVFLGALPEPS